MELRQLRIFSMAAELQSFTKTAAALSISQPAVSQQIAMLEHELETSLFVRRARGVVLTDAGRRMYDSACKALECLDDATREICHTSDVVTGRIHIACCTIPTETFLPAILADFRKTYPLVSESVKVSDSAQAAAEVEKGDADLGFVIVPPRECHLNARPIICHELVLVAAPDHRCAELGSISVEEIRNEPFILREPGSGTRHCAEQALMEAGISPEKLTVALETNSNDAIRKAVNQNIGIAFLTKAAVLDDIEQRRVVALRPNGLRVQISVYLVTDPKRMPTPAARAFLAFVG